MSMIAALAADDLWPLVQKLPHEEQVRLAKLALMAAARGSDGDREAYRVAKTTGCPGSQTGTSAPGGPKDQINRTGALSGSSSTA